MSRVVSLKSKIKNRVEDILSEKNRFARDTARGKNDSLSDEEYIKKWYYLMLGKECNLVHPQTFNEKLQWLKVNDRNSEYTTMVDKYSAKNYVAAIIGSEHIIPTLGVWNHYDEIDFEQLPNQFVLKCTHDSGGVVIIKDKASLNDSVKEKLEMHLKRNYYYFGREWPYKNVKPRIIAEPYMQDDRHVSLPGYKLFCFHGEPKIIELCQNDKQADETLTFYDTDWNLLDIKQGFSNAQQPFEKPHKLKEMIELAKKLAKDRVFLRVDFYLIGDTVFFSELTFFPSSGFLKIEPEDWDSKMGSWIRLPLE